MKEFKLMRCLKMGIIKIIISVQLTSLENIIQELGGNTKLLIWFICLKNCLNFLLGPCRVYSDSFPSWIHM